MNTLLMVAYYFAPAAVVGTQRMLRFAKYLPRAGWRTVVVTADERCYDLVDPTLSQRVDDDCVIYRTRAPNPYRVRRVYQPTVHGGMHEMGLRGKRRKNALSRLLRHHTAIPDTQIGWLPFAIARSLHAIKRDDVDVLLTTSYPYTAHLIGLSLKQLTNKPWIADFRDPWCEYAFLYPNTQLHRMIAETLEMKVVRQANRVIANTPVARDRMRERYPAFAAKMVSIPNGFDREVFEEVRGDVEQTGERPFTIVHTGTLYPAEERRNPLSFLQAIAELLRLNPALRDQIQVRFVGHTHYRVGLPKMAAALGLAQNVVVVGHLSHKECLREMLAADALLLLHHSGDPIARLYSTIPAKTYEYLGARKPILCLSSHGAVVDLISAAQAGRCVDPRDVDGIRQAIESLYRERRQWTERLATPCTLLESYEAHHLTGELAHLLDLVRAEV